MLLLIWMIYFVTDVYGHIALKMATGATSLQGILFSIWGVTAVGAWLVSGVAWTFVLSKHPLLTANAVSALTYVLITVSAVIFFNEPLTRTKVLGMCMIAIGIYLIVD